jgi:hypothetical protein
MTDTGLLSYLSDVWLAAVAVFFVWEFFQYWYFDFERRTDPQAKPCGGRIFTPPELFVGGGLALLLTCFFNALSGWPTFILRLGATGAALVVAAICHHEYRIKPPQPPPPQTPRPGEISETAKKIIDELSKRP